MINVLYLTGSLFMLEVYDRVLPSRSCRRWSACWSSLPRSISLQAVLDVIRGRMLAASEPPLDETLQSARLRRSSFACR